ncbi:MAG: hypothetical protein A3B70_00230 [Deltaproteobacteria bacterium RIFCSPHIGHO2_02_FULL_40_11]|nr:MAG: hypothetical protein A3B70_00230 [Deltaproteobacteria bacterium RIFCSPHIGHO2_02_FULL_40_11]
MRRIQVQVKPNAKHEKIEKISETEFKVWVKAPPKENKANQAVIQALALYFKVPQSHISLLRGTKGKVKLFEIP